MNKTRLLIPGLILLFAAEILRVYFIMPFPGSQRSETIQVAYFLDRYIWLFRALGVIMILPPLLHIYRNSKWWKKITLSVFVLLYLGVFYLFNFKFLADKMFYQPQNKVLSTAAGNNVALKSLVLGVSLNGESKAYPIEIIGYHHQVRDTVGGQPVMVTYCTVCRTGRVFSPYVNGRLENFRLVGMDHFNAMFEDEETKSWWRQATGVAVAGPLKGSGLKEIPSQQSSLAAWMRQYPNTLIMQPDAVFTKQYEGLAGFDEGNIESGLEKRDPGSWQFKSWVVGVQKNGAAKAYDWNDLVKQKIINDTFQNLPLVLVLEHDNRSFHVWNRKVNEQVLEFTMDEASQTIKDNTTGSVWNMHGEAVEGSLKGSRLSPIQAYQEFWHSWESFHPGTWRYDRVQK
jgi:Protein of unknown function (DUF3179)